MKFRTVTLSSGATFQVPQGIQRIDAKSTHGWQVRHLGTKFFSDGPSGDPQLSLVNAVGELLKRLHTGPISVLLRQDVSPRKQTDLPVGIFGPIVRNRPGRAAVAELSVLLPRFGRQAQTKNIYIGSESTYSVEKYLAALEKGQSMRAEATEQYERDAARAKRQAVQALRSHLRLLTS